MPKQKTHKGLKKRIKISARGKVMVGRVGKSHLMAGTSSKSVRNLRGSKSASKPENRRLAKMLRQG